MVPDRVACPRCHAKMRVLPHQHPGMAAQCPACSEQFPLPARTGEGPPNDWGPRAARPWTPTARTEDPLGNPLKSLDEPDRSDQSLAPPIDFSDDDRRQELEMRRDLPDGARYRLLDNRFVVRIGDWLRHGLNHIDANLGPVIVCIILLIFLSLAIVSAFNCPMAVVLLLPLLESMFSFVALRQLNGRNWVVHIPDLFRFFPDLFRFFWRCLVLSLLYWLLIAVLLLPGYAILYIADILDLSSDLYHVGQIVLLSGAVLAYYLHTRCFFFATQLVLDRDFGPLEAIQGSWHLTARNIIRILFARFVLIFVGGAGYLVFCFGALFTLPLMYMAWNAGYLLCMEPPFRTTLPIPEDYDRRFRSRP